MKTRNFMLFQNILVPYDDSKCALHAVKVASNIAKKYNARLTVATCLPTDYSTGKWYTDKRYSEAIIEKRKDAILKALKKPQDIAKKENIQIKTKILEADSIVKEIVSFAKSSKIDLIVMGSRGKTAWNKLVLGSVASGVSQSVHCPVLLVR